MKKLLIILLSAVFVLCSCTDTSKPECYYDALINHNLPIMHNSALYRNFMFDELVQDVKYIFYARVVRYEESFICDVGVVRTPVVISVIETIKGEPMKEFTYNQDGGRTESYFTPSASLELAPGTEGIFFFSNDEGATYGPFGVWPVIDGRVISGGMLNTHRVVIDGIAIYDYNYDYGVKLTDTDLSASISNARWIDEDEAKSVSTCSLEDFIVLVHSMLDE
jgi:hypothetical protein